MGDIDFRNEFCLCLNSVIDLPNVFWLMTGTLLSISRVNAEFEFGDLDLINFCLCVFSSCFWGENIFSFLIDTSWSNIFIYKSYKLMQILLKMEYYWGIESLSKYDIFSKQMFYSKNLFFSNYVFYID